MGQQCLSSKTSVGKMVIIQWTGKVVVNGYQDNTRYTWIQAKTIVEMCIVSLGNRSVLLLVEEVKLQVTSQDFIPHAGFFFTIKQSLLSPSDSTFSCSQKYLPSLVTESMPFCHYLNYFEWYDIIALPLSACSCGKSHLSPKSWKNTVVLVHPPPVWMRWHYSSHQLIISLVLSPENA